MSKFSSIIIMFLIVVSYSFSNAQGQVSFYDSEGSFASVCETLPTEDFEDTLVGPNTVGTCPGPISSEISDVCYAAGALLPGFTMSSVGDGLGSEFIVAITPNFLGVTNVAAGSNSFDDDTVIAFDPTVTSVAMNIVSLNTNGDLDILVYGIGNVLLGSTTVSMPLGATPTFVGIQSVSPILRVELDDDGGSVSELLYDLSFGECTPFRNVPTLSEWGLIAMAALLGIVGFMVIRRRQIAA